MYQGREAWEAWDRHRQGVLKRWADQYGDEMSRRMAKPYQALEAMHGQVQGKESALEYNRATLDLQIG